MKTTFKSKLTFIKHFFFFQQDLQDLQHREGLEKEPQDLKPKECDRIVS